MATSVSRSDGGSRSGKRGSRVPGAASSAGRVSSNRCSSASRTRPELRERPGRGKVRRMKRAAIFALVGAALFSVLTTWLGPKMIGWYVTPADQPAAMSCQAAVIGAMHRLVQTQMIGTLAGAILGLGGGLFLPRQASPPPPPAPPDSQPPPPPAAPTP